MVRVVRVQPDSIADALGIVAGTELLSVNGRALGDFLDWEFLTAEDVLEVEARLPDGEMVVYDIERPEGEPMGLELELPTVSGGIVLCREMRPDQKLSYALRPSSASPAVGYLSKHNEQQKELVNAALSFDVSTTASAANG